MKSSVLPTDPSTRPHSAKLLAHAVGFGVLVGLAVLIGQLLWARLMPQSRPIDLASLPTCLSAVTAGLVAYCEARWPERTLAFLGRAASPLLLAAVVFLAIVAAP
ncbi:MULTISPECIES: hypothetical protein [unclassified Rhodanobacter]|uniref:hypothetical protein n=1 Tax=unclassified Rhodanobacter TaxID=2621553 RepID=UPI0007AA0E87|nr:hypothetical protein [Rhodanobacter sp. FW510-R10]KZC32615.1 hypothetical protein RhoFW510R10_11920 [Rhodanobacter sp. FW510-R10]